MPLVLPAGGCQKGPGAGPAAPLALARDPDDADGGRDRHSHVGAAQGQAGQLAQPGMAQGLQHGQAQGLAHQQHVAQQVLPGGAPETDQLETNRSKANQSDVIRFTNTLAAFLVSRTAIPEGMYYVLT